MLKNINIIYQDGNLLSFNVEIYLNETNRNL